jgi:hypothetical protein
MSATATFELLKSVIQPQRYVDETFPTAQQNPFNAKAALSAADVFAS